MEEMLDKLNKTRFDGLYKNKDKELGNQEERRKLMLNLQKINRSVITDRFRGVLGLEDPAEAEQNNLFQRRNAAYRPQIYVAGFNKCAYRDVLMQSEWMVEKPSDFELNWYVVPCPKGIRTLVIAKQGRTKLYSQGGYLIKTCQTSLPGGSYGTSCGENRCCILDGFILLDTNTVYILDLLAWNSHLMADGETEFRHYWLLSQIEEIRGLGTRTKDNHLAFKILPKVPCDRDNFAEFMMRNPHFPNFYPQLDGLLFYHKQAHYVSGVSPLMGWLYPFMVPEVFGSDVKISLGYMMERPVNYVNQAKFIENFPKKKEKRRIVPTEPFVMDTTPEPDDNDFLVVNALTESGAFEP